MHSFLFISSILRYLINPEIIHESTSSHLSSEKNSISEDEIARDVTSSHATNETLRRISSITEEALELDKGTSEVSAECPKELTFSGKLRRSEEVTEA